MMRFITKNKVRLLRAGAVLLTLAVWQAAAWLMGEELLLPAPAAVLRRLTALVLEADFWRTVLFSFARITAGFLLAFLAGVLLGFAAGRVPVLEHLLWPLFSLVKSVLVASFIVISLIWLSAANISVFISFLMVLPIVYTNVLNGMKSAPPALLEMTSLFGVSSPRRLLLVYLPALRPYLLSGCGVAIGLAWKAGVAAEIIGIPDGSIGEKFYFAKVYFATGDLFAWTAAVVCISVLFEKLFLFLLGRFYARLRRL